MKCLRTLIYTAALSAPMMGILAPTAQAQPPSGEETQAPQPKAPEVGERVAAVVNDDPISTFDIRQRVRLMMVVQSLQVTEENAGMIQQQALQDLVEERLKLQEAERMNINIPDAQVNQELARIAAAAGGDVDTLIRDLAGQGISVETLRQQIRANAAWEQLVRGRFGPRVSISSDEVEDKMDELREDVQQEQLQLAEICLPMQNAEQGEQMYAVGMQMIDQMRQGVPFQALAQQFSACPSAARGGDMGWMRANDLDEDLTEIVEQLGVGSISRPVPHEGMLKMLAVRQKRPAAAPGEPAYQVAYAGADISIGEDRAREAFARLPETNACNGNTLSTDLGPNIGVTMLPMLREAEFDPAFHAPLAQLSLNAVSDVIEHEGAYHAILLCEKDEGLGLPRRQAVENQLEGDALELLSRRYLRDVERDSAIEIRLSADG
ncbi:MAG: peptidylprolyl isomerase [Pseudomonadota bacterium]